MSALHRLWLAVVPAVWLSLVLFAAGASGAAGTGLIAFARYSPCPLLPGDDPKGRCYHAIHLVDTKGTSLGRLTKLSEKGASPAWSPDASELAYTAYEGTYLMRTDGTRKRRLCTYKLCPGMIELGVLGATTGPTWSPDGRRLAFASHGLQILNADGTHLRSVPGTAKLAIAQPDWSPDGKSLVFVAGRNPVIQIVKLDGTGIRSVARMGAHPRWSPDGKRILFANANLNGLYLVDANGGTPIRLTPKTTIVESATWSPDGTRIAYFSSGSRLHILTLSSGHDQTIQLPPSLCGGAFACFTPDWQPPHR